LKAGVPFMPHLTITCSANLAGLTDLDALCRVAHAALMANGLFEPGAPRVRVILCEQYAIADLHPANAFADATLRMGAGRSPDQRKELGEDLMMAMGVHFTDLLEGGHFALSLDIQEIEAAMSWKRNAIHARLRGSDGRS
jgi:5-carboxymethyl-2-hydroxymuconate isomerase